jgi:hypothetical protein
MGSRRARLQKDPFITNECRILPEALEAAFEMIEGKARNQAQLAQEDIPTGLDGDEVEQRSV